MALRMRITWLAAGCSRMPSWPMRVLDAVGGADLGDSWVTSGFQ